MISDPLERLRAANPEPSCPPPPIDEVWRRIEAGGRMAQDRVAARPGGPKAVGARLRSLAGGMAVLTSVVVVIAVGAIALLLHSRRTVSGDTSVGTHQLVARLAVLRRPQSAADALPAHLHIMSPLSPPGRIIPRLTRLVRTLPDARLYLVVTTPSSDSLWSARLGDQVSIVEVSGGHATETVPIPAVDLTNANEVFEITPAGLGARAQPGAYNVGIVPDGVARVRWTFPNKQYKPGAVLDVSVADNVAVTRSQSDTGPLVLRTAWYAPGGQRVATSNRAILAAQAARNAALKAQAIRDILQHPYRADRSLLAAFSVFDITSRAGVKTAAGNIISHPPLSSLPLDILQGAEASSAAAAAHGGGPMFQLDFSEVREVTTPTGERLYVIPGRQGMCLAAEGHSPFPDGLPAGGGGESCTPLAPVESQGVSVTYGAFGVQRTYKIVPKSIHHISVRTSRGTRTTIPVPDGIYVSPAQRFGQ
jgi:hypothetical protein